MSIQNLNKIIKEKNMQFEKTREGQKDNSNGTEVDLFVALIKTIQDTSKQTQDMVRAVADNQKMLYSMLKKVMEKLEINYDA